MAGPKMPTRDKTLSDAKMQGNGDANRDPQQAHEDQLAGRAGGNETGVVKKEEEKVLVQVLGEGHFYNNHPLPLNCVIELPVSEVDLYRERGYQFGPVDDDYDGEVYDWTTEWQHPDNERVSNDAA